MAVRTLVIVIAVTLAPSARAQVADHLKCYSAKDPAVKALYTADLQGLVPEPGCQIKVPAKLVCVPTPKTNIQPTPPNPTIVGSVATMMVCYKVKCAKAVLPPVPVADQFGTRTLTANAAKLLCAPVPVPPTTTTSSTTVIGTTSTIATTTSTTTLPAGCGNYILGAGEVCDPPYSMFLDSEFDLQLCNASCSGSAGSACYGIYSGVCPPGGGCGSLYGVAFCVKTAFSGVCSDCATQCSGAVYNVCFALSPPYPSGSCACLAESCIGAGVDCTVGGNYVPDCCSPLSCQNGLCQ